MAKPKSAQSPTLFHLDRESETIVTDAQDMVAKLLPGRRLGTLSIHHEKLCKSLMTAVILSVRFDDTLPQTWASVLCYIVDPAWDTQMQIVCSFLNFKVDASPTAQTEVRRVGSLLESMTDDVLENLFKRFHLIWAAATSTGATTVAAAESEPESEPSSPRPKRKTGAVQVFSPMDIEKALHKAGQMKDESQGVAMETLKAAMADDGFRQLPDARKASQRLGKLLSDFENLAEPIEHLQVELALARAMPSTEFRIAPLLLLGEPGIGKTYLALQLANALGVPMEKISAGGSQPAFGLVGSHPTWNRAMPGALFGLLANGKSASPVFMIDEVDKIAEGSQYPLMPTLLDLLENNTAKVFRDEFFGMQFDASRLVVVMTANEIKDIPAPLLSRANVFHVPRPKADQRLRIIQNETASLNKKTRQKIELDHTAETLAERVDLDLRQTMRLVRESFTRAMMKREPSFSLTAPPSSSSNGIGFLSRVA